MSFSIAIVGAGPAGLTLARLLQVAEVDVAITIFEKDVSPTARFLQGGTLDLHTDTGLAALRKAGLWKEAHRHLRYDGEELSIADKNATVVLHKKEAPTPKPEAETSDANARPEIDREVLKDLLLHSVKPEWVKWGKTLQSIDPSSGMLIFRDDTTAGPFDLVVGADGAWSKVRQVLTDVRPQYSGICGFESRISDLDKNFPKISKMLGKGSYFAQSDHKSMTGQRMGDKSMKVAAWIMGEETYPADTLKAYGADEGKLKEQILDHFKDWAPELREWVQVSHGFRAWPLYELPVGEFWEHKMGYTMIGDAASLMTPFAGEGVNKAMKDALELAEAVEQALRSHSDVDQAVKEYEVGMFPRAEKYQMHTMRNKKAMFGKNGPVDFLVAIVDMIAAEMGVDLSKGWLSWVPFKTVVYCYGMTRQTLGSYRRRISERLAR